MPELTPEQKLRQARRLHLEEMEWTMARYRYDLKAECECSGHVIIRGWLRWSPAQAKVVESLHSDSASCCICGVDLGWWCPVNPKGYCEYDDKHGEDCIHCRVPEERK